MFELLSILIFGWLLVKAVGLAFALTWGVAKILAAILIALAVPVLLLCLILVGGVTLLLPLAMIAAAVGIVKACL